MLKSIKKKSLPHNPPGTFQPSAKITPENHPSQPLHWSAREPVCASQPSPCHPAPAAALSRAGPGPARFPGAARFPPLLHSQAPARSSPSHSHSEPTPGVTATTEQKSKVKLRIKTRPEQTLPVSPPAALGVRAPLAPLEPASPSRRALGLRCSHPHDHCRKPSKSPGWGQTDLWGRSALGSGPTV